MNATGWLLGSLALCKWFIRTFRGYAPMRWRMDENPEGKPTSLPRWVLRGLFVCSFCLIAFCLISALNARATWVPAEQNFRYRDFVSWLPHSYDQPRSWQFFANYFALACWFWATVDWLLGKTDMEARAERATVAGQHRRRVLPERLRRVLWVLSLNGFLLGVEGLIQRGSNTNKLLWLIGTRENRDAQYQFGPYAYRSNAAQYFNLVWPVTLAFWWTLRREVRRAAEPRKANPRSYQHLLLMAVLVMATCPVVTASRAGAVTTLGCLVLAAAILLLGMRRRHPLVRFGVVLFCLTAAGTGLWFGWEKLGERMKELDEGFRYRERTYETARQIAKEHPLFGTGPGTFEPLFQFYRESREEYWPAYLHNDWLETLITFGWTGSVLIAVAFGLALGRWFAGGGVAMNWRFPALLWLSLGGCLLHARFDFPLQIYSVLMVFLLICAILCVMGRRTHHHSPG